MVVDLPLKKIFVSLVAFSFLIGTPESVFAGGGNNIRGTRTGAGRTARMPFSFPIQNETPPLPVEPLLSVDALAQLLASAQPFGVPLMTILPKIQHFVPLTQTQLFALAEDAHNGDIKAQDQLVQRNYWALLNMGNPESNSWLSNPLNHKQELSPLSWSGIEERGLQDPQYAYTLINAYGCLLNNTRNNPNILSSYSSFLEKFLVVRQSLQTKAEAGDPDAQFNLGVLYYHSSWFPQYAGLGMTSDHMYKLTSQWLTQAATQGHPHAHILLGARHYMGHDPVDSRYVGALRWFLPAKDNETSKKFLRDIICKPSKIPEVKGTFHEKLAGIERLLERVRGSHICQIGLHNPQGQLLENKFAIPELIPLYEKMLATEDEVRELLFSLKQSTPGFMLNGFYVQRTNPEVINRMISQQSKPHFVANDDINGVQYLTFGEKNVALATSLLAYVEKIDEKFKEAEKTLMRIENCYQGVLDSALGELMTRRLFALKKQDEKSILKLEKQRKYVEELEPLVKPHLEKIKEEHADLEGVKNRMRNLISSTADKRNRDFEVYLDLQ